MGLYRKKPIVIEAVQFNGDNVDEIESFTGECHPPTDDNKIFIFTPEGNMLASVKDFIIKGVNGEFYPCNPDIFEKTYENAEEI